MKVSLRPPPYASAVSSARMPRSHASSSSRNASSRLVPWPKNAGAEPMPPKLPQPSTIRVTATPLRPSARCSTRAIVGQPGRRSRRHTSRVPPSVTRLSRCSTQTSCRAVAGGCECLVRGCQRVREIDAADPDAAPAEPLEHCARGKRPRRPWRRKRLRPPTDPSRRLHAARSARSLASGGRARDRGRSRPRPRTRRRRRACMPRHRRGRYTCAECLRASARGRRRARSRGGAPGAPTAPGPRPPRRARVGFARLGSRPATRCVGMGAVSIVTA